MTVFLIAYAATLTVFLMVDAIWLGRVARDFYARELGGLMRARPNLLIAALFYAVYVSGIVLLAVLPALAAQSWTIALGHGLVLGLCAYGAYNITNMATLKDWPMRMSIVDLAWGTTLTGIAATGGFFLTRLFL